MERPLKRLIVFALLTAIVFTFAGQSLATNRGKAGGGKTSSSSCSVSPNPVASGGDLTVSGKAGHSGDWVNAYLYYSDGTWLLLGGSAGSGGTFSFSGTADATHSSLWGPFYPAATGPASVEVHAGSASRDYGVVQTCTFSVN
jgi:hypothetical protein